jgi:hypothetical protein
MRLFEGGILDKITSDEYEKMFQHATSAMEVKNVEEKREIGSDRVDDSKNANRVQLSNERQQQAQHQQLKEAPNEKALIALSLQMLQGAFYLLILGYFLASLAFVLEIGCHRLRSSFLIKYRSTIFHLNRRFQQLRMRF